MRILLAFVLAATTCLALGCGGGSSTDPLANTQTPTDSQTATTQVSQDTSTAGESESFAPQRPAKQYAQPGDAVSDFLVAVKSGDDKTATALLTTAAQKEAWTNGLAISSDGFAQAEFKVSEVEYLKEKSEAHVMSLWSDVSTQGERKSFQCLWLLRQEEHGWCIYGMATKFLDDAPPVVLNFENQREMQRRQQWAEQQIVKHRSGQATGTPEEAAPREPVQQATRPGTTVR